MKKIISIILSFLLSASVLQASAFEKYAKQRGTKAHISSEKPLTTGSNTFILDIQNDNSVIQDAKVSLKAFMPAMPGMPAMQSKSDAKSLGNGKYEVTVNLSMGGTWQLHIFITPKSGKKSRIKTSLDF